MASNYGKTWEETKYQWNMAEAFLMRLDRRLDEFQIKYYEGNLKGCYLLLKVLVGTVAFKFLKIKDLDFNEYEKMLDNIKIKLRNYDTRVSQTGQQANSEVIEDLIYNLYKQLNIDLQNAELIFRKHREFSFQEAIEADFE